MPGASASSSTRRVFGPADTLQQDDLQVLKLTSDFHPESVMLHIESLTLSGKADPALCVGPTTCMNSKGANPRKCQNDDVHN